VSEKFGCNLVEKMRMGSMFRVLSRWEVGVYLGWLLTTRRHFDWITWSLG